MVLPNGPQWRHITAIANLPDICAAGALLSKNSGASAGVAYQNIAHQGAQGARSVKSAPNPPGGVVHDYVPFYFAPRSPMLFAINGGRVEGCPWKQGDILHLETTVERVATEGVPFVFYDRNATLAWCNAYTDLDRLDAIAWDLLTEAPTLDGFCKFWKTDSSKPQYADRMERRQAEFLVKDSVPLEQFIRIGTIDDQRAEEVGAIFGPAWVRITHRSKARMVLSGAMSMAVTITQGDLLRQDDVDAIVNTVNCVGIMGKGIALQFKNKWPLNYRAYEAACKAKEVRPGRMFVFDSGGLIKPNYIINFPTKDHWRGKSQIEFIRDGLNDLVAQVKRLGIRSVAIPPLGCGNGGLDWNEVRPLIVDAFASLPNVEVRLFEPAGAPDPKSMEVRTTRPRMTSGRAAILKVLHTYRALDYGLSRVEVQKLAYFLQEAGENLKLSFVKHQYGPYSDELRHALNRMEGHFIRGLGDGVVEAEIEPMEDALKEADHFLAEYEHSELGQRIERVARLIDGFQSPYGMELLATVHWVVAREQGLQTFEELISAVHAWNKRKAKIMQPAHLRVALDRLIEQKWVPPLTTRNATTQMQADIINE